MSRDEAGEVFRILFVCSGNTCRSPLAEAIARAGLEERGWTHVRVASAGTFAGPGAPASEGALRAAERHGLDLSDHRSRPLEAGAAAEADLILAMAGSHLLRLTEMGAGDRATLLSAFARSGGSGEGGGDVPDPFGGGDEEYEETFRTLERLVGAALDRMEPLVSP